jgi:hypothetical protein
MATYNFYSDAGHGWLKVPKDKLAQLNIADKISTYSYMNGNFAYLEEDCDLSTFIEALKAQGMEFNYTSHNHPDYSPIRQYKHYEGSV